MHRVHSAEVEGGQRVQLLGSGAILREALRAADILAEKYRIASDVWSVTSYTELRREAQECRRWNMLNPEKPPRHSYLEEQLGPTEGPVIASSDYLRILADQLQPWLPNRLLSLGTDGMGRSESREALRRHFEVDAELIVIATLHKLMLDGKYEAEQVAAAIRDLGVNPEKQSALYA
jgi:pyruvate dehydrogenase E1 component